MLYCNRTTYRLSQIVYIHMICNRTSPWRRRAATPSAPGGHFSAIQFFFQENNKNVSKSIIFCCKKHKNTKSTKKSTAIFEKSIQMKTHFYSTKAKVYFLGVYKSNPFSQIPRSPDPQILRFYEKIGYIFVANPWDMGGLRPPARPKGAHLSQIIIKIS